MKKQEIIENQVIEVSGNGTEIPTPTEGETPVENKAEEGEESADSQVPEGTEPSVVKEGNEGKESDEGNVGKESKESTESKEVKEGKEEAATNAEENTTAGTDRDGDMAVATDGNPQPAEAVVLCAGDAEVNALLDRMAAQMAEGKVSDDMVTLLRHALDYDRDVAQARHEGEVEGRNQRIREYLIEQRVPKDIHNLQGGATLPVRDIPAECLGGLQAADRRSIWQRGNERRIVR